MYFMITANNLPSLGKVVRRPQFSNSKQPSLLQQTTFPKFLIILRKIHGYNGYFE